MSDGGKNASILKREPPPFRQIRGISRLSVVRPLIGIANEIRAESSGRRSHESFRPFNFDIGTVKSAFEDESIDMIYETIFPSFSL